MPMPAGPLGENVCPIRKRHPQTEGLLTDLPAGPTNHFAGRAVVPRGIGEAATRAAPPGVLRGAEGSGARRGTVAAAARAAALRGGVCRMVRSVSACSGRSFVPTRWFSSSRVEQRVVQPGVHLL